MDASTLLKQATEEFLPPPKLLTSEWAEDRRYLSAESSAEPGKWRNDRTPYLVGVMDAVSEPSVHELCIMSSAQVGKALYINTKIPTLKGWKFLGDLQVGDYIFDDRGLPTEVVFATEIMLDRTCWKLTFSDSSEIIADSDHRWTVDYSVWGRYKDTRTITTREMVEIHSNRPSEKRNPFAISLSQPLKLPSVSLPVDPYLLGVWLGDGISSSGYLSLNLDDSVEILNSITKEGYFCEIKPDSENVIRVIVDPKPQPVSLYKKLKKLNLLSTPSQGKVNKFIPRVYLRASIEQRLALLQGLMDTDGSICPKSGRSEFTTVSIDLANGFSELLSSLGIKHTRTIKHPVATYKGKKVRGKDAYRFSFLVYDDKPIYRLSRKLALMVKKSPKRRVSETTKVRITNIERVESVPVRCIQVDSESHLYLAGERMIPTHNTELISNVLGRTIDIDPCPILALQPTLEMAQAYSKDRFAPMVRDSPALRAKISESKSRDKNNTILHKNFPGGQLTFAGANSPSSLASRPVRMVLCDEIDRYPISAGTEGDPVNLARKRTTTFWNWLLILVSTPTIKNASRIESAWEKSDRRRYFVDCPSCGHSQYLVWENVEYAGKGTDSADPKSGVYYLCENCHTPIHEKHKPSMVKNGYWKATATSLDNTVGFHLNELYSLWRRWEDVALDYEVARLEESQYRVWFNTSLGLPYELAAGEKLDWQRLRDRASRSDYRQGEVPSGGSILTAGVDVQADRLEVAVWAWGRGEEAWLIRYEKIIGNPLEAEVWEQLVRVTSQDYLNEAGESLRVRATCIDSGYLTQDVYRQVRKFKYLHWFAIKGVSGADKPLISAPSYQEVNYRGEKIKKGIALYKVGVDTAKETLYARSQIETPGSKYLNFPKDLYSRWFEEFCSEVLVTKHKNGRPYTVWEKLAGVRNEALDISNYALAAAYLVGINRIDWNSVEIRKELVNSSEDNSQLENSLAREVKLARSLADSKSAGSLVRKDIKKTKKKVRKRRRIK